MAKSKLIPVRVLSIPNIDFAKYVKLKNSRLTIFSSNCWGGMCYHRLGLEFLSPLINMWEDADDFNKLMLNLDTYLSCPVEFVESRYEPNVKKTYPLCRVNDVLLHFNHYEHFDQAAECWERRKKRINKDNVLVVSYATSKKTVREFEDIPYGHKLMFTPLDLGTPSSYHLDVDDQGRLWAPVNATAKGSKSTFDLIALCNHEKDFVRTR